MTKMSEFAKSYAVDNQWTHKICSKCLSLLYEPVKKCHCGEIQPEITPTENRRAIIIRAEAIRDNLYADEFPPAVKPKRR